MTAVSVLIPVYNDAEHIAEAIDSALAQTLNEVEVIVVDDGSTDYTPELLRRYDDKIAVIRQRNQGVAAALNRAFDASRGKYVCFLGSDDTVTPGKAEIQVKILESNPDAGLCCGVWEIIDEATGSVKTRYPQLPSNWTDMSKFKLPFVASSPLIRREWVAKVNGFDETVKSSEDYEFWWRLGVAGCKFIQTDYLVTRILARKKSKGRDPEARLAGSLRILDKHYSDAQNDPQLAAIARRRYAQAWLTAGAGRLRLGNLDGAAEAWAKALSYDADAFLISRTWSTILTLSNPEYPSTIGEAFLDLSLVEKRVFGVFKAASLLAPSGDQKHLMRKQRGALRLALGVLATEQHKVWKARWFAFKGVLAYPGLLAKPAELRFTAIAILGPVLSGLVVRCLSFRRTGAAAAKQR